MLVSEILKSKKIYEKSISKFIIQKLLLIVNNLNILKQYFKFNIISSFLLIYKWINVY